MRNFIQAPHCIHVQIYDIFLYAAALLWKNKMFFKKNSRQHCQNKQQTITLHFREIERILGDNLPWEAYCFDAFWYDDASEMTSSMWRDEDFPFRVFCLSEPGYNITHSWSSQGYTIKALHRERSRVVFRKVSKNTSGVVLPKAMVEQQLPDEIIYKFNQMVRQFMKDNGI